jgi:hypothetical protein
MNQVEKLFGDPFTWDAWTATAGAICQKVLTAIHDNQLTVPVDVELTSVTDAPLLSYRIESLDRKVMHILNANESLWQEQDIYPITAMMIDATGKTWEFEVDPRPKKIQ